jgi:tRNA wybutosine-synthesizing protein 1
MFPDRLAQVEPPTQLYLSVDAPNEELFKKIDQSTLKDGWNRLMQSLGVVKDLNTRTALRFTLIKGMNMEDAKGWGEIIKQAQPMFVEVKAYMFVGFSRLRLKMSNMPRHHEVKEFAEDICRASGYKMIDEKEESRVVLLMKEDKPDRIMKF